VPCRARQLSPTFASSLSHVTALTSYPASSAILIFARHTNISFITPQSRFQQSHSIKNPSPHLITSPNLHNTEPLIPQTNKQPSRNHVVHPRLPQFPHRLHPRRFQIHLLDAVPQPRLRGFHLHRRDEQHCEFGRRSRKFHSPYVFTSAFLLVNGTMTLGADIAS